MNTLLEVFIRTAHDGNSRHVGLLLKFERHISNDMNEFRKFGEPFKMAIPSQAQQGRCRD